MKTTKNWNKVIFFGMAAMVLVFGMTVVGCDTGTNGGDFVPVTGIIGVPVIALTGEGLVLSGIVVPANATNKTIIFSGSDVDTTSGVFTATTTGYHAVTAAIVNGAAESSNYTQTFTITAYDGTAARIADMQGTWTKGGLTMVITNSNWVLSGQNYSTSGVTVTGSRGVIVDAGLSAFRMQATGVTFTGYAGWWPVNEYSTGIYTKLNASTVLITSVSGVSDPAVTGTWTKQP